MQFYQRLKSELDKRKAANNLRELPFVSYRQDNILLDGIAYVDLSSNDYLGIAREPRYFHNFLNTMLDTEHSGSEFANNVLLSSISAGATGSRLLTGNHLAYAYIEELLTALYTTRSAMSNEPSPISSLHEANPTNQTHSNQAYGKQEYSKQTQSSPQQAAAPANTLYPSYPGSWPQPPAYLSASEHENSCASIGGLGLGLDFGEEALEMVRAYQPAPHACAIYPSAPQEHCLTTATALNQEAATSVTTPENITNIAPAPTNDKESAIATSGGSAAASSAVSEAASGMAATGASAANATANSVNANNVNAASMTATNETVGGAAEANNSTRDTGNRGTQDSQSAAPDSTIAALNRTTVTGVNVDSTQDSAPLSSGENSSSPLTTACQERACLYLSSGFTANEGVISTLWDKNDLLLVDKLSHASIINGMMQSKAKALRFRHNDMEHLASLLQEHAHNYESVVIITESVFSMDGDQAKLKEIVALKKQYSNVLLYVDEAHSFGLFAEDGLGLCRELHILDQVDFLMGTLSKAIGSYGAFLICAPEVKEYLINFMRPFIYSTALPAINVSFSMYVISLLQTNDLMYKREYLKNLSAYLHHNLAQLGLTPSESQIQPLKTCDSASALSASEIFKKAGLLALPIRYPTVPQNQARLRLSLNSSLRIDDIDLITSLIQQHRDLFA